MSEPRAQGAGGPRRPGDVRVPDRLKHLPVDSRGYPVIVTIPQSPEGVDFGAISELRKLVMATYDACAVCGYPFADEDLRWQVQFATGRDDEDFEEDAVLATSNEAPVHKICALYAVQVCPFVSSPYARLSDEMRKGQQRGDALMLRGYRRTADVRPVDSELQSGVDILLFEMDDLVESIELSSASVAREAYEAALAEDSVPLVDDATAVLIGQFSTPAYDEDAASVLAGGALVVGAAFLDGVINVQGMRRFDTPERSHFQVAAGLVYHLTWADGMSDPHLVAAIEWLKTRDSIPEVLGRWREHGRRITRVRRDADSTTQDGAPRRRGPDKTAKRKARRAARRKKRR